MVVIPTLRAGGDLRETLDSLAEQTYRRFGVIVVDNSGQRLAQEFSDEGRFRLTILSLEANAGFGGAVNRAVAECKTPLIALLNDDAAADATWLESLVEAAGANPACGMFSCQIRMADTNVLDSTALDLSVDGSSIQRGHGEPWAQDSSPAEALLPSGCAALYRREALRAAGGFDERFFLYCEDTDLGLRLRWLGWRCLYVRDAIVHHKYSRSAGVASPLKAYLVERNRLFVVVKNFPMRDAIGALVAASFRYVLHALEALRGRGKAREFSRAQSSVLLPWMVAKAHLALFAHLPRLLRQRRAIRAGATVSQDAFREGLRAHRVSLRKVAQH